MLAAINSTRLRPSSTPLSLPSSPLFRYADLPHHSSRASLAMGKRKSALTKGTLPGEAPVCHRERWGITFVPNTETASNTAAAPAPPAQASEISIPEYVDNWDEYFLWIATAASIKSKDPRCRVGAVIVSPTNVLLSTGFNGLARGVHDDKHVLDDPEEKLKVICHAEQNAILNAARVGVAVEGASIFVTKFPCLACCNHIIQVGIKRIYTHDKWYWNDDPFDKDHSRKRDILHQAHIKIDAPFHPEYSPKKPIDPKNRNAPMRTTTVFKQMPVK
jgi:dCMP deaminase